MKTRQTIKTFLILAMTISAGPGYAEDPVGDVPDTISSMPQFSGKYPPTPLSTQQETDVLDAVFLRFPGTDRGETMAFIREHFPEESREFTLMAQRNLGNALALLIDLVGQSTKLMELRSRDPEHFAKIAQHRELERKIASLSGELKGEQAQAEHRGEAQLRGVLSESFMLKQDLMKSDIENMEQQLEALKRLVKKREINREVIIDNRYLDMVGKLDHLKW